MTNRLFIALDILSNVIHDLISLRDEIYGLPNNVRWVKEDKIKVLNNMNITILHVRLEDDSNNGYNPFHNTLSYIDVINITL